MANKAFEEPSVEIFRLNEVEAEKVDTSGWGGGEERFGVQEIQDI